MDDNSRFSIRFAERFCQATISGTREEWLHAYLMLVEEADAGAGSKILQELHFNRGDRWIVTPALKIMSKPKEIRKSISTHIIATDIPAIILARWLHGLRFAEQVKNKSISFDREFKVLPTAVNCRTGAKKALEVMGFNFRQEFAKSAAGTQAVLEVSFPTYSSEKHNGKPGQSWQELWKETQCVDLSMPCPSA